MQRYFSEVKKDNLFLLKDEDLYHIKTVMRMNINDEIEVVYEQKVHICKLDKNYNAIIEKVIEDNKIKKINYVLCVPILQEQKMSFILQKATELGVDLIIPILTARSMVKVKDKENKKIERWKRICKEASEQSKRVTIPEVSEIKKITDLNLDGLKIVCSTKEKDNTLKKVLKNNLKCDKIIMVVGPEGGLTLDEENKLIDLGFIPTSLGDNILRVETAPLYLLSVLNYEMEWLLWILLLIIF